MAEALSTLLAKARTGDAAAVGILLGRFQPGALALAAALLGDGHLAEDAVQAAFVSALAHLSELRDSEAFAAWFRQIVRTECNRLARRRWPVSADTPDRPDEELTPAERVLRQEQTQAVRAALAALTKSQRETAELFYLDEMGCAEIAGRLGVPVGTVKRRLHDARQELRLKLRAEAQETRDRQLPL